MNRRLKSEVGPLYQRIKQRIVRHIETGEWLPSHRVPSEHELVRELGVSRMTINRALRELASEGYVTRVAGVGTFVADMKSRSHLVEIHDIADEVHQRGHEYGSKVILHQREPIDAAIAALLQLARGHTAFHSIIVHLENDVPIQVEDRYVSPEVVPGYGRLDLARTTPAQYLLQAAPLQDVEHVVQARIPKSRIAKLLRLDRGEPCLIVNRRTWSGGKVATVATLYHPGSRFELSGHFHPGQ